MERNDQINLFLETAGLVNFKRTKIPGDASFRHYERIQNDDEHYILMDAPPKTEDVKPFINIAEMLLGLGLSAPRIIARDIQNGFLLLEDFGNKKFNKLFTEDKNLEPKLYKKAIDVLVHIYRNRQNHNVAQYDNSVLMREAKLFTEWYLPLFKNFSDEKLKEISSQFEKLISTLIDKLTLPNDNLVLRDYHADNLMYLKNRAGVKSVGLLDFQDALIGNVAYDLVSLLEDARRDVSQNIQQEMIEYFIENSSLQNQKDNFLSDYAILGAQRNLKIIGIFSRLKVRDKKEVYLPLIPRVIGYLKKDLQHPSLAELNEFLISNELI
jgi:aminoglycoside/choline kinase family phosphotransferase